MRQNNHWSEECWDGLCKQLCADFGPALAAKIVETIVSSPIAGARMTIPTIQDLQRRARDRKICSLFTGDYIALAERFGLSETSVRRIVLKQRMIDRSRYDNDYSP